MYTASTPGVTALLVLKDGVNELLRDGYVCEMLSFVDLLFFFLGVREYVYMYMWIFMCAHVYAFITNVASSHVLTSTYMALNIGKKKIIIFWFA